jgi:heme b synthase
VRTRKNFFLWSYQLVQDQPRIVFWETTAACNLECVHCRRLEVSRELSKSDLTTDEARAAISSIAKFAKPILILSGGEPLMRPDIFTLAQHARQCGLATALATNGTLITHAVAQEIKNAEIKRVSVSIDGADARTHDEFRRIPGSFDRALQGIQHLKEHGISVQLNCTIARHNVNQLDVLFHLAETLGADAFHIFMLVPVGCGVEIADDQMLSAEQYERVLNHFYDLSKHSSISTKVTCAPHYQRIIRQRTKGERLASQDVGLEANTRGCLAGSAVCFISHQGEVFPCGYLPVSAGNIKTQPFAEIWQNAEVFRKLRDPDLLKGKCGQCEYRRVCMGCRARAYAATGDFLNEEPFCLYQPTSHLDKDR